MTYLRCGAACAHTTRACALPRCGGTCGGCALASISAKPFSVDVSTASRACEAWHVAPLSSISAWRRVRVSSRVLLPVVCDACLYVSDWCPRSSSCVCVCLRVCLSALPDCLASLLHAAACLWRSVWRSELMHACDKSALCNILVPVLVRVRRKRSSNRKNALLRARQHGCVSLQLSRSTQHVSASGALLGPTF